MIAAIYARKFTEQKVRGAAMRAGVVRVDKRAAP